MYSVTIVILNYNLANNVRILIHSIYKYVNNLDFLIVVVDNNSPDREIENLIEEFPDVKFELLKTNYGFGHGNNYALKKYESKFYLLLNPDTRLVENSVRKMYDFLEQHKEFGIVGCKLIYEDNTVQESALQFPNIKQELFDIFGLTGISIRTIKKIRHKFRNEEYYESDFIFGSCMMIRKDVVDKLGGFDEDYFLFSEETDLCFRTKKILNYKVGFLKSTKIKHIGGAITNKIQYERIRRQNESKLLFFNKHYSKAKVVFLRFLKILSFLERSILVIIKKKKEVKREYLNMYYSLIKHYLIGKPIINKKTNDI